MQSFGHDETGSSNHWSIISKSLSQRISPSEFENWIKPLKIQEKTDEISLIVPNVVFFQGLHENYRNLIEECCSDNGLEGLNIRIDIGRELPKKTKENTSNSSFTNENNEQKTQRLTAKTISESNERIASRAEEEINTLNAAERQMIESLPKSAPSPIESKPLEIQKESIAKSLQSRHHNLNPSYTFESFVKGESNQFAHATCMAVADQPGLTYNPLFIYGSTGLGKTHLLHAVGRRILAANPNAVIYYTSSERFMNEMIYCLRFNKMWEFKRKYRNIDVFLVDDIQFISGKERTQEEFFHTFNALYEAKKQIVMTSDMFPQDIPDIEDRLRNRFQWGLIADIQPPSVEHRMAILMNKAEALGFSIEEEVALFVANHAKRNIRELEGALHRILAYSTLHARTIDLALAQDTFQGMITESPNKLTIEMIQKAVSEHFKIKLPELKGKKRMRALTVPLQVAMYLCRIKTKGSYPEIGEKFGGKDHTTVMHAVKKITKERDLDLDLKANIETLERKLDQLY